LFWLTGFWFLYKIPLCSSVSYLKEQLINTASKEDYRISIIIPARNEEKNLDKLFESLKTQTFKPHEIILVNDQSTDATENVAKTYGAKVINIEKLPKGWLGKPWACFTGAKNSSGNILLFLDADTELHKEGLKNLFLCYLKHNGVITVQPYHNIKKFYENFAAYFNLVLMGSMNAFTPLQHRAKPIGAFGPCLLCDRKSYFSIDGHGSAKSKVLEDLEIGKKFIKNKINVFCFGGRGDIDFRMYPDGIKSVINGFSRGFSSGAKSTSIINLLLIVLWISVSFYPLTLFFGSAFNFNLIEFITGIIFYVAYALQLHWMLRRIGSFSPIVPIFFPVFVMFFIIIFLWSIIALIFKINIKWKDRSVNNRVKK
jgi:4,4'-diaponeurosporenoate glycosyltransferase